MPTIFEYCPGRVTSIVQPVSNCNISIIDIQDRDGNPELTYEKDSIVLTRVNVAQNVNVQFLHTLGNRVYVYAFGDRMGQIQLSGMAFLNAADDCLHQSDTHSAKNILNWYRLNKSSTRSDAIRISLFDTAFQAFLVGLTADVIDDKTRLVQWNLTLATLPE